MNFALPIEENCKNYPEKTCIVDGSIRMTYGEMEQRASRLAHALAGMGVSKGDRVAIFQTNCYQFVEMIYAIAKVGGIIVTLNFRLMGEEAAYILNNSGAKVLLVGDRYAGMIESIRKDTPSLKQCIGIGKPQPGIAEYEALLAAATNAPYPCATVEKEDTACLIYTSGTTGRPKGAMLTYDNINALFAAEEEEEEDENAIPVGPILVNVPMYHIAGINTAVIALHTGEKVVFLAQFEPGLFLDTIEKEAITFTYVVPTMLQAILDHPDFSSRNLSSLKLVGYGASPMPLDLLLRAKRELPTADYSNYFGMTEAMGTVSACAQSDHKLEGTEEEIALKTHRLSGIGHEIPRVEVRIFDDQDREVPAGTVGEIVARGRQIMKGYWGNPTATEETLRGGWLHTGDLAYMDEDGFLYLQGRKKDMIIRGGENIYPVEIEAVLEKHPQVAEVAVIGVPDKYWGEIVKAVCVLKPGEAATEAEIINYCKLHMASYKKPAIVEFRKSLPRNAMQKVLKTVLRSKDSG
jgi:acyl-CoA synthetase (AMP-forming)/AMP-acid ligase II